jgi:hypothetical protein
MGVPVCEGAMIAGKTVLAVTGAETISKASFFHLPGGTKAGK